MKVYSIKKGGFEEVRKQLIRRLLPTYIAIVAGAIIIGLVNESKEKDGVNTLPFFIPLVAVMLGFSYYRGINRQRAAFESYTLTVSDVTIIKDELGKPTISLYLGEVQQIYKTKNGSFVIKGRDPGDIIGVPAQIEDYDELEAALQKIKPFTASPKPNLLLTSPLLSIVTIGCMIAVAAVNNKIVVAVCAVIFSAVAIWSFYTVITNKNIEARVKRNAFWLLLVLAIYYYGGSNEGLLYVARAASGASYQTSLP